MQIARSDYSEQPQWRRRLERMLGRHILVAAFAAVLIAPSALSAPTARHGFANAHADRLMTKGLAANGAKRVECLYIGGGVAPSYVRREAMECYGSLRGREIVWTFRPYRLGWMRVTALGPGGQKTRRMSCVRALRCY
jgi:hypothetical protein